MKRLIIISLLVFTIVGIVVVCNMEKMDTSNYLRIHIRANSNSKEDQDIKYAIKGEIVKMLSPKLDGASSPLEARRIIANEIENINNVANEVLSSKDMPYRARTCIRREHFPTRHYGNLTLGEGEYEALIVELGRAEGNNWWCVVFPPLCFVEAENTGSGKFEYVSKIKEWIDRISR